MFPPYLYLSSKKFLISEDQSVGLLRFSMCKLSSKESLDIAVADLPYFKMACKWPALASQGHYFIIRAFGGHVTSLTLEHLFLFNSKKLQSFKAKGIFQSTRFL